MVDVLFKITYVVLLINCLAFKVNIHDICLCNDWKINVQADSFDLELVYDRNMKSLLP